MGGPLLEPNDTIPGVPAEPPVTPPPVIPPAVAPPAVTPSPVRARPRGRTALIVAAAALLGIAGGTAVGYGIQAERPPTPLPALSQADLVYPAKALPADRAPDPLPASQDRQVRTDGDLRKLLMDRPAGWSDNKSVTWLSDGWIGLDDYARDFKSEDSMLTYLLETDVRRVAGAAWKKGQYREANVWLVQFGSGAGAGAVEHAEGQLSYMPGTKDGAGNEGDPVAGSGNGRYYVYDVVREPGYMPSYRARAVVQRGDIMIEVNMFDTEPISKKDIRTMAERQLERL